MESVCVICKQLVNPKDKSVVKNPRKKGLLTLVSAARRRKDECGKAILKDEADILSGKIKVLYHQDCRKSYTSEQNIQG